MIGGSRAICATPLVNDPRTIQEAWTNTEAQYPGLVDAMRKWSLQKGTAAPAVGDQNVFWVYNLSKRIFDTVRAELKAIGTISYVWVALGEWNNGHVTTTEVDAILSALEHFTSGTSLDSTKGILQIDRQVYGDPPNINSSFQKGKGDGKTTFLICDIQDGWIPGGSYVAGFFFSVDVDPNSGAVNTSNRRRHAVYQFLSGNLLCRSASDHDGTVYPRPRISASHSLELQSFRDHLFQRRTLGVR